MPVSAEEMDQKPSLKDKNFRFTNCNITAVPLYVKQLNVTPDPIKFGETVNISSEIALERDLGANGNSIEVDMSLRLKTDMGSTELCDIIGEEKCHYNNFCVDLNKYMGDTRCPPPFVKQFNNNCSCPFLKKTYELKPISFKLPELPFGVRGTFEMTINIEEQGNYFGCIEIQFCISNCRPLGSEIEENRMPQISSTQ